MNVDKISALGKLPPAFQIAERRHQQHTHAYSKNNLTLQTITPASAKEDTQGNLHFGEGRSRLFLCRPEAYKFTNDGNSFYRIAAINHIQYLTSNQSKMEQLLTLLQVNSGTALSQALQRYNSLNASCLGNQSIDFFTVYIELVGSLMSDKRKHPKQEDDEQSQVPTCDSLVDLINSNPYKDFVLVSVYRIFTYLMASDSLLRTGVLVEEEVLEGLLRYGQQVNLATIRHIAQALEADLRLVNVTQEGAEVVPISQSSGPISFKFSVYMFQQNYYMLTRPQQPFSGNHPLFSHSADCIQEKNQTYSSNKSVAESKESEEQNLMQKRVLLAGAANQIRNLLALQKSWSSIREFQWFKDNCESEYEGSSQHSEKTQQQQQPLETEPDSVVAELMAERGISTNGFAECDQFFQAMYDVMSESEKKEIVLAFLREAYQSKINGRISKN